jgi:hypothetical protein
MRCATRIGAAPTKRSSAGTGDEFRSIWKKIGGIPTTGRNSATLSARHPAAILMCEHQSVGFAGRRPIMAGAAARAAAATTSPALHAAAASSGRVALRAVGGRPAQPT